MFPRASDHGSCVLSISLYEEGIRVRDQSCGCEELLQELHPSNLPASELGPLPAIGNRTDASPHAFLVNAGLGHRCRSSTAYQPSDLKFATLICTNRTPH